MDSQEAFICTGMWEKISMSAQLIQMGEIVINRKFNVVFVEYPLYIISRILNVNKDSTYMHESNIIAFNKPTVFF